MKKREGLLGNPRAVGVACATAATGLGLVYMAAAGAPALYLGVNALALGLGLAAFALLRPASGQPPRLRGEVSILLGALLLATALFGASADGVSRWIRVAGLSVQLSLVVLPAMLVAFAHRRDLLATAGLMLAAVALALQPDRAMAGVLASALAVLALRRRDPWVLSSLAAAVAGFAVTLARPDTLPAAPFVERVLFSAFDVHALAGLAVVSGALLLAVPALAGRTLDPRGQDACAVFGVAWLGAVVAAALGNYPTPLVGYGGSAVLGYALSLAFLPARAHPAASSERLAGDAERADRDGDSYLRVGVVPG